jgi:hypothetical protein
MSGYLTKCNISQAERREKWLKVLEARIERKLPNGVRLFFLNFMTGQFNEKFVSYIGW